MLVVRRSCVLLAGLFGARRVLGMGRVFFRVLGVDALVMGVFFVNLGRNGCRGGLDGRRDRHVGMQIPPPARRPRHARDRARHVAWSCA